MTTTRPASKEGGGRTKVSEGRVTFYLFERGRSRPSKQHAWSRAARTVSGGPCSIRAMAVCSVRCAKRLGEQRRGAPGRALQGQLYWLLLVQPRVRLAELPLVVVVQGRRAGVPRHVLPHEGRRGERERERRGGERRPDLCASEMPNRRAGTHRHAGMGPTSPGAPLWAIRVGPIYFGFTRHLLASCEKPRPHLHDVVVGVRPPRPRG